MTSPFAPPAADAPRGGDNPPAGVQPGTTVIGYPPMPAPPAPVVPPMYWRVLRLSAVRPNGWQRAILVEGVIGLSVILALADVASAWTVLVLPLISMAIVMAHDYLAGLLDPGRRSPPPPARAADYAWVVGIPVAILLLRVIIHPSAEGRDTTLIVLGLLLWLGIAVLVYRYLVRRGVAKNRAAAIGAVTFLLSPLAGVLGATLEARRRRMDPGSPASPPYDPS